MLQGDCLLSFAIGSALATAGGDGIKASQYRLQNKYFLTLILHLSVVVRPLAIYMLWEHTGFETLHYYDASINGVWPALNSFGSMLAGIGGYMTARKLLMWNMELAAYTVWTSAFSIISAALAAHYDRVLYPGTIRDFYDEKEFSIMDIVQSELFPIVILKFILTMAPVQYAQIYWPREEGSLTKTRKWTIVTHCAKILMTEGAILTLTTIVLTVTHLVPDQWGWDRVLAVMCGQVLSSIILLLPIYLMSTKYTVTKRIDIRRTKQAHKQTKRRRHARPLYTHSLENGIVDEDAWEENSEYSVGDGDDQALIVNGGPNHTVIGPKDE